ncbi:MAG: DUF3800 domain-containing protein [Candidatus Binataceae bacterium]
MALDIFVDESGYTGEHELDTTQPIFVLSSTSLSDGITAELFAQHFSGVKAKELKHSRLAKRPNGRQMVVNFIRSVASMNAESRLPVATVFPVHKKFQLLTLLVDLWVEPAMREAGIDLYEQGRNLAIANFTFCALNLVPPFLDELLRLFQVMMRDRAKETYDKFWRFVYRSYRKPSEVSPDPETQMLISGFLSFFLDGQSSLGPRHLLKLPRHSLDATISTVYVTAHHWDERAGRPLRFTLDESKYFAESKWMWEALTRSDLPKATFQISGDKQVRYPLNVEATRMADSKQVRQLQLADIVAGATAELSATRIDPGRRRSAYADALVDAGIHTLLIGGMWPSADVTPEEMGTSGMSGKHLDYLEAQLRKFSS